MTLAVGASSDARPLTLCATRNKDERDSLIRFTVTHYRTVRSLKETEQ